MNGGIDGVGHEPLMHTRPMFVAAFTFGLGILIVHSNGTLPLWALCLVFISASVCAWFNRPHAAFMLIWLGLGILRMTLARIIPFAPLSAAPLSDIAAFLGRVRESLVSVTSALFGDNAGVISAMLWGDKSGIPYADLVAYRSSGTAHVLAISGLHVSFFVGGLSLAMRRCSKRTRLIVIGVFLAVYAAIAAFPASLVRAAIMAVVVLFAPFTGRRSDMASSISFAFIVITAISPEELFSIGFQLSFASVFTIAMLYPRLEKLLSFLPEYLCAPLCVSLAGTLGTLPLSVYYFGEFSSLSLLSNLLIIPVISVAVPLCFIAVMLSYVSVYLSFLPSLIGGILIGSAGTAAKLVSSVPFAVIRVSEPSVPVVVCFYIAMLALSRYVLRPFKTRVIIFCSVLLLMAVFITVPGVI